MLNTYCVGCHNTRLKTGGLALDGLDLQAAADDAQIWEKALRKLRGHQMPPPGSPQPPQKDVDSFVAWMENALDCRLPCQRSEGGLCADPAPEPHRVRRVGESSGGRGREREGSSAAGHPGGGLRQHRGRLERVSRVPRSVRYRGAASREARGRQSQSSRFQREVLHRGQPKPGRAPASGHARRHQVQTQLPGRRRVSHHHQRPWGGPVHRSDGEREHAGHHDRWQDRVSANRSADRRIRLSPIARREPDALRSWSASRRFPCR